MKKRLNILGIIPARGGSKGIPKKNIKILGDKPLIYYTIKSAKRSVYITDLIVSTDDLEIAKIAESCGANVPFIRPKELALNETPMLPVLRHAVDFMEKNKNIIFDYIVILQPTSPFRLPEDIDKTIEVIIEKGADSAVSLVEVESQFHPMKMKKFEEQRVLSYTIDEPEGINRQDLPKVYRRSSAVYVQKRDLIVKKNQLYGDYIVGHIVPAERYIDIDNEFDWLKAEYMLKKLKDRGYNY